MIPDTFSELDKVMISKYIKRIDSTDALTDFYKLREIGSNAATISPRSRIGNNVVDFFTFKERLNTKGKYSMNYYEFITNLEEFKKKKFINNMLTYYRDVKNKNKTKNEYIVLKEVYNICISAINIFRPLVAMQIYLKYNPVTVLDFTCGWGGRLIGACALNVPNYIGIDLNSNLSTPYGEMINFLSPHSQTKAQVFIEDAVLFDYSSIEYDMVLTSPPYYFLEKYSNNCSYGNSKEEMNKYFYIPLFTKTFKYLKNGGHYCLNINKEIYDNVCVPILGVAQETIELRKSKRQNDYGEFIYIWYKTIII
jgi:hypothetical protein